MSAKNRAKRSRIDSRHVQAERLRWRAELIRWLLTPRPIT
jgi:hypothetical protein